MSLVQFKEDKTGVIFALNPDYVLMVQPSLEGIGKRGARIWYAHSSGSVEIVVYATFVEVLETLNGESW